MPLEGPGIVSTSAWGRAPDWRTSAPTLLAALGQPIPQSMTGKPMLRLFDPPPPVTVAQASSLPFAGSQQPAPDQAVYSKDDEKRDREAAGGPGIFGVKRGILFTRSRDEADLIPTAVSNVITSFFQIPARYRAAGSWPCGAAGAGLLSFGLHLALDFVGHLYVSHLQIGDAASQRLFFFFGKVCSSS